MASRSITPPCSAGVQTYAPTLERRIRRHLRPCNGSWRVDETYIKVRGVWTYLYRAVDSLGQTIDFMLSARRNATAAKRFFRKALRRPHTVNPRTITVDKNAATDVGARRRGSAALGGRVSRLATPACVNRIEKASTSQPSYGEQSADAGAGR